MNKKLLYSLILLALALGAVLWYFQAGNKGTTPNSNNPPNTNELFTYVDPILGTRVSTSSAVGTPGEDAYAQMSYSDLIKLAVEKCPSLNVPSTVEKNISTDPERGLVSFSYLEGGNTYVSFTLPYRSEEVLRACPAVISDEMKKVGPMSQKQREDDCRSYRSEVAGKESQPNEVLPSGVTVAKIQEIIKAYCQNVP